MSIAVKTQNLSKLYHLYNKPIDRLKEALHPLRKQYHHDFFALDNINFEIKQGETFGIIGRNGAGKSTLLKILTGVLTQTSGEIVVNGKISALLELGAGFNPEMTGMENVFFSGTIMGFEPDEMRDKLDDILAFADIGEFIDQPVKTYSSGMFARLAFAIAANVDPDILIVDEALAVGDFNFQSKCFARFKKLQESGKTIIFVSHDLNSVISYCTKAMLIEKGQHLITGNPKEVVDAYKRVLVGLPFDEKESEEQPEKQTSNMYSSLEMKKNFNVNENATTYGNGSADIIDYGVFDKKGNPSQKVLSGEEITIAMTVRFNATVNKPIFACTLKDVKGLDITGSNTLFENIDTGEVKEGEIRHIEFKLKNTLKPGGYFVSFGVTNYIAGDFVVYARAYDILTLEVISDKHFVGFFDPEMQISVRGNLEC